MNRIISGDVSWIFQRDRVVEHVMRISRLALPHPKKILTSKIKVITMLISFIQCRGIVPHGQVQVLEPLKQGGLLCDARIVPQQVDPAP